MTKERSEATDYSKKLEASRLEICDERDALRAQVAELTQQRDEARGIAAHLCEPSGPLDAAKHAPMTYETFVLLRKAVEAQCVATEKAQEEAAELRAQVEELTQQRDHAIQMHALRGKAMLLLENPEVSAELRAQVATLQAERAVKDAALLATRIYVEAEVYTYHDKASEKVALIDAALSSSPGAPLLAAVEAAVKALECARQAFDSDEENAYPVQMNHINSALSALAPYHTKP